MVWRGDVGIITTRIDSDGDENLIELWGRSRENESVLLRIHGMQPWFEVCPPGRWDGDFSSLEERLQVLENHEEITHITGPVEKWTDLGYKPVWKAHVTKPFVVPGLRRELSGRWYILSGDIPFANRFFLDGDFSIHISVKAEETYSENGIDIVADITLDDVEQCQGFPVPWKIFSFDLETSIAESTILCAAVVIEDRGTGIRTKYTFSGDEEGIMVDLTNLVLDSNPDIITGYNIDNFDLTRLNDRMTHLTKRGDWQGKANLFGWGRVNRDEKEYRRRRDGLIPKRGTTRAWNISGRCVMDCWWQARQVLRPERETLSFVSNLLFPNDDERHKMDIDASKMDEEWANRPDEVLEYCLRDAELPLDIMAEIQAVRRCEAIASVSGVSLDTVANGNTSQRIDALVIKAADRGNIGVPLTGSADPKEGQITGGYVHDVEAGLHPWIAILDFKSMYPSIMIGNNICYTTRVDQGSTDQPLEDEELFVSPTGAKFRNPSQRQGLIPLLLEDLMAQRDANKAALAKAKDPASKSFYDQMQYAVKILMNSFYGVFASGFYRFTHRDLGSSITAWARHNIKKIIQRLEDEGHGVVYSDTDSIFVSVPLTEGDDQVEKMIKFGHETAQRFSEESAVLEFEKGLSAFFSHGAKKRYIGQVVWPNQELMIRGYETQRTDSFAYLTTGMKRLFEHILAGEDEETIAYSLEMVRAVKEGEVDIRDLILSKSCKGRWDKRKAKWIFTEDYANPDSMAQVRVAKQILAKGLPFTPGMKVSYVVENATEKPMRVRAWYEEEAATYQYDAQFYAERLATALGRVTEAFGWNAKELLSGNRQTSLFSF